MKILALVFILALSAYAQDERLSYEPAQAAEQIRTWIPAGTSQTEAKRIMVQNHFICSVMTNCTFGDLKAADFLYCNRSSVSAGWSLQQCWQVALVLTNSRVSDVRVIFFVMQLLEKKD
jgi:Tfp pilus assembly protein PilV